MAAPSNPSLSDWNWVELMLHQALIGAVSPNFRMVELAFEDGRWIVRVTLREESAEDREEVAEVRDDLEIFMADVRDRLSEGASSDVAAEIVVSDAPIRLAPRAEPRVVFLMRQL